MNRKEEDRRIGSLLGLDVKRGIEETNRRLMGVWSVGVSEESSGKPAAVQLAAVTVQREAFQRAYCRRNGVGGCCKL